MAWQGLPEQALQMLSVLSVGAQEVRWRLAPCARFARGGASAAAARHLLGGSDWACTLPW